MRINRRTKDVSLSVNGEIVTGVVRDDFSHLDVSQYFYLGKYVSSQLRLPLHMFLGMNVKHEVKITHYYSSKSFECITVNKLTYIVLSQSLCS